MKENLRIKGLIIILLLSLFIVAGEIVIAIPQPKIFAVHSWLTEQAAFVQDINLSKGKPALHNLGAFGVGNGAVFALVGLGFPQNKLTNIVGPTYEKSEGEQ